MSGRSMQGGVIFPSVASFSGLEQLSEGIKKIVSEKNRDKEIAEDADYANFFLFGDDLLGARISAKAGGIVEHERVVALIPKIQQALKPRYFVIFSIYVNLGSLVVDAAYLIGKKQWRCDFKRVPQEHDVHKVGRHNTKDWEGFSKLNIKSSKCINGGGVHIKNLHLFVCADIVLIPETRFTESSIVFVPASFLVQKEAKRTFANWLDIRGSGRIFINDPRSGNAWYVPFGVASKTIEPEIMPFEKNKKYAFLEFEL